MLSSVGMNVSAQEIVTKKSTISKNTKVDIYKATVQSGNGERTYRVFAQTSKKYKKNSFISLHGCAVCSRQLFYQDTAKNIEIIHRIRHLEF